VRKLLFLVCALLVVALVIVVACNPADDGPTKCDHYVTSPVLATGSGGQPIPVPDGGIVDKTTCDQACDGAVCGSALVDGSVYVTCLEDAGVDCYR
jgi:hypothetical protein